MPVSIARYHDAEICCCRDAVEAMQLFAPAPSAFQLIITDLNIKPVNGAVLCARLRAMAPDVRVLLMTGDVGAISEADSRKLGFRGTLFKPFTIPALVSAITEAMKGGVIFSLAGAKDSLQPAS